MEKVKLTLITACLLLVTVMAANSLAAGPKDLAGEYVVAGWEPGSNISGTPDYKGWVTLQAWGEAWKYLGLMDGQNYTGVGIYDDLTGTLSLSFVNEDNSESGVTVLKHTIGQLKGRWVYVGYADGKTGTEIWTRKK